jgi:tetratricopeptide (TPR) repeat protein
MRREYEFEAFLKKNNRSSKYMGYCEKIEKAFGGMDIDDIILSHQNISKVRKKLEAITSSSKTASSYISGLNAYLEFAFSSRTPTVTICKKTPTAKTGLVVYENTVPVVEQISGLCEYLEEEYEKICGFAQTVLQNIWQVFPKIPVYLSEKKPTATYYYDREFILKEMEKYCSECPKKHCNPPYCGVAAVLEEYTPFTVNVTGYFIQAPEPHIEIFFRQFDAICWEDYASQIVQVLAHEYLHYLHYAYAKEKFSDAEAGLKEALADFFGVLYSVKRGGKYDLKVAEDRYNLWKKREGSNWPYAYALHFLSEPYKVNLSDYDSYEMKKAIEKLREVFRLTPNAKDAYLKLIN